MDRFTRLLLTHRILSAARQPVSRQKLQDELECSAASVKRIIRELRDYAGAPIIYDRERNGYCYERENGHVELAGLWFSSEELIAFATLIELINGLDPGLLDHHLKPIRQRLEHLIRIQELGISELPYRLRLLSHAQRTAPPKLFHAIATATFGRYRLHARYRARGQDKVTERDISPQRIVHYRHNWYLDAWCHLRNELRTFALERFESVDILTQEAQDIPEQKLQAYYASSYGLFSGAPVAEAVIRFSPRAARWVADESWHPEQKSGWLEDGSYELCLPYSDPTELIMDVLRYGPEAEVISPEPLRQLIKERLQSALAQYTDRRTGSGSEPVPMLG